MRLFGLVLAALVLAGLSVTAQQAPPAAPAADSPLDTYLLRWEQEMKKVETLSAEINRVVKVKSFDTATKLVGWAAYKRRGSGAATLNQAAMELRPEGKREFQEKYVCTGARVFRFKPAQKEIEVFEVPKPKEGQVAEDGVLAFMFGMPARDARARYDLRLAKEDRYYIYVDVLPRLPQDKSDFQRARLVLNKDSFLPRQLWFEGADGTETLWDIPRIQTGTDLDPRLFDQPATPPGWRLSVSRPVSEPKPRVIRGEPQGP
jgi:TIGR03009 family protein